MYLRPWNMLYSNSFELLPAVLLCFHVQGQMHTQGFTQPVTFSHYYPYKVADWIFVWLVHSGTVTCLIRVKFTQNKVFPTQQWYNNCIFRSLSLIAYKNDCVSGYLVLSANQNRVVSKIWQRYKTVFLQV